MTTEREAFENWAKTQGMGTVKNPNSTYVEFDPRQAWSAWQASRKVALEDAAKVCSRVCVEAGRDYADGFNSGSFVCERRIKEILK